jgi:hypothetical protein
LIGLARRASGAALCLASFLTLTIGSPGYAAGPPDGVTAEDWFRARPAPQKAAALVKRLRAERRAVALATARPTDRLNAARGRRTALRNGRRRVRITRWCSTRAATG